MNKRDFLKFMTAGFVGGATDKLLPSRTGQDHSAQQEDVSERILRTGVMRAAYIVYPPYFIKDINTGKFSGIYYDMMTRMAAELGVKIEWVEEVSFANPFEGFYANRYDIVCGNVWPNGARVRRADFTLPVCYSGFNAFTIPSRVGEFHGFAGLDRPGVRIAVIEGEGFEPIAKERCPHARLVRLPNTASNGELVMQVLSKKADVTLLELAFAAQYLQRNPGAVRSIESDPLQVHPNGLCIARHQHGFKAILNMLVEDVLNTGFVAELLTRYQSTRDDFIRVARPYQFPA